MGNSICKKSQISGPINSISRIFKSFKDKRKKEMEHLQAKQNVHIHKIVHIKTLKLL